MFLRLPPVRLSSSGSARWIYSPRIALLLFSSLLMQQSNAHSACPAQKLISLQKIEEKGTNITIDRGTDENSAKIELPLNLAISADTMRLSGDSIQTTIRIPVNKRLWRFTTKARRLTAANLHIQYSVNDGSTLQSEKDPSSKIGVSIVNRKIDVTNRRKTTRFDAYVDLIIDYSRARLAGNYIGTVTITVDCTLT